MRYTKSRSDFSRNRPSKKAPKKSLFFIGAALLLLFIWTIWPKGSGQEGAERAVEQVVQEQDDVSEPAQVQEVSRLEAEVGTTSWTQEVMLEDVEGTGGTGIARRGVEENLFTHVVVAELPAINTETHFYEGWLVRPGVLEFFSTGEMFAREDGKWGLVWEQQVSQSSVDLDLYREVVITREPRDGNPAPSPEHVIEGVFTSQEN